MSYVRIPYYGPVVTGAQDEDNFVRNLLTVLVGSDASNAEGANPTEPRPLSQTLEGTEAVVDLDRIKLWCHIDADQDAEDEGLLMLEMAARLHTQNVLRRAEPLDASCGENVKLALLTLIAYWYRNREAASPEALREGPLAYKALLSTERNYSGCY